MPGHSCQLAPCPSWLDPSSQGGTSEDSTGQWVTDMCSSRCNFSGNGKNYLNLYEQERPLESTLGARGSCRVDRASTGALTLDTAPPQPSGSFSRGPLPLPSPTLVSLKFNLCERGGCVSCSRHHVRRRGRSLSSHKVRYGDSTWSEAVREAMVSNPCLLCHKMELPRHRR